MWKVQEGLSGLPLKQTVRSLSDTCLCYSHRKGTCLILEMEEITQEEPEWIVYSSPPRLLLSVIVPTVFPLLIKPRRIEKHWGDGLLPKTISCYCREPKFCSQNPCRMAQNHLLLLLWEKWPYAVHGRLHSCTNPHTCTQMKVNFSSALLFLVNFYTRLL